MCAGGGEELVGGGVTVGQNRDSLGLLKSNSSCLV